MSKNKFSKLLRKEIHIIKKKDKENYDEAKNTKLQTKITVISIFIIVLSVIGTSYAAFVWSSSSSNTQRMYVGDYTITFDDTSPSLGGIINLPSAFPMTDTEGKATTPYKFKIQNNGNVDTRFAIRLVDDSTKIATDGCAANLIPKQYIKVYYTVNNSSGSTYTLDSTYDNIIYSDYLIAGASKDVTLRVWIASNAPNSVIGKHFHGKLLITTKQLGTNWESSNEEL